MDNQQTTDQVELFLTKLLKDAGLDTSLPQVVESMKNDLRAKLDTALIVAALRQLSPEKLQEFNEQLAPSADQGNKNEFFADKYSKFARRFLSSYDRFL